MSAAAPCRADAASKDCVGHRRRSGDYGKAGGGIFSRMYVIGEGAVFHLHRMPVRHIHHQCAAGGIGIGVGEPAPVDAGVAGEEAVAEDTAAGVAPEPGDASGGTYIVHVNCRHHIRPELAVFD